MANIPTCLIDSAAEVSDLVDLLPQLQTEPPSIYIDLEGTKLSRSGNISILTLLAYYSPSRKYILLIDIHKLGSLAFNTPGKNGTTLKSILEAADIPKVFFDLRNDSDALYAHFGIQLQGVEDVQLMENAARRGSKKFLNGLGRCIELDVGLPPQEIDSWRLAKEKGEKLFQPERGGSYEVFNERPLPEDMIAYCAGDVQYLPLLRDRYWRLGGLTPTWKGNVVLETKNRVVESQRAWYQPHGSHKALGPW